MQVLAWLRSLMLFAGIDRPLSTTASAAHDEGDFIHASVFDYSCDESATSVEPKPNKQRAEHVKNLTMASFLASSGTVLQGQRLSANRSQQCAARRSVAVTASHRVDKFSKNDVIVSPSILSADFAKLGEQVRPPDSFRCRLTYACCVTGYAVQTTVYALAFMPDRPCGPHSRVEPSV